MNLSEIEKYIDRLLSVGVDQLGTINMRILRIYYYDTGGARDPFGDQLSFWSWLTEHMKKHGKVVTKG